MELTSGNIAAVEKATDLLAVGEENPTYDQLKGIFGPHTYFVNEEGLYIFESARNETGETATEAYLFAFAMWAEEDASKLVLLNDPAPTGVVLDLEKSQVENVDDTPPTIH